MNNLIIDLDGQKIEYKNPKLKGLVGTQIQSKIREYATGIKTVEMAQSKDPVTAMFVKLQTELSVLDVKSQAYSEKDKEFIAYAIDNSTALILASNGMGNPILLFEILELINKYYQITAVTVDDYNEQDIVGIILWILKEPKNNLEAFLELYRPLAGKAAD